MSSDEMHRGVVKEVCKEQKTQITKLRQAIKEFGILPDCYETYEHEGIEFVDYLDEDSGFIFVGDKLFQFVEHEELEDGYHTQGKKLGDGLYSFSACWYNGGAGFEEVLEDCIKIADEEAKENG